MPLYEYQCQTCGSTFELLRRMRDGDDDLKCPRCHSSKVERRLSAFSAGKCGTGRRGFR